MRPGMGETLNEISIFLFPSSSSPETSCRGLVPRSANQEPRSLLASSFSAGETFRVLTSVITGGEFHDQGDNVEMKTLPINSNLNHQTRPSGGQPPGGRPKGRPKGVSL
jgi:hypothetical protein